MAKIISCCGLNCTDCEARIATITNNNELRIKTAELWSKQYHAADITPEMINCTGCREPGVKLRHCEECLIRKCADSKGYITCASCSSLENCDMLTPIHKHVPDALANLKTLR